MKIRNLNAGDTFRFPLGIAKYIMLNCVNTDEIGWLIEFANIRNGQRYQYIEPPFRQKNDPTKRKVIRIKKEAVRPKPFTYGPDWRNGQQIEAKQVEQAFGIKLSKKTITK